MSLTASEEALVRQLLDQQAALLSLAGNEATITSKLGATKVTLSNLVAASSVSDADLFLTRQGVTDKSVTAAILAQYALAELDSTFVNVAGDTMTGALVLSAGGSSTTPAIGDAGLSIATTEFIKKSGLTLPGGGTTISADTTLTASQIGNWFEVSVDSVIVTLPTLASVPNGSMFMFKGSLHSWQIKGNGSEVISNVDSTTANTYSVSQRETVFVVKGTSAWAIIVSGFGGYSFLNAQSTNGYQKLPSNIILQWGNATATGTTHTGSFNIAFPNACYNAIAWDLDNVYSGLISTMGALTTTTFTTRWGADPGVYSWFAIGA